MWPSNTVFGNSSTRKLFEKLRDGFHLSFDHPTIPFLVMITRDTYETMISSIPRHVSHVLLTRSSCCLASRKSLALTVQVVAANLALARAFGFDSVTHQIRSQDQGKGMTEDEDQA